jgi:hypothetical protein
MNKYLAKSSKTRERGKKPEVGEGDAKEKDGDFPDTDSYLMIFGRLTTHESWRRQKLTRQEVYAAEPATPAFLRWSESTITFQRFDQPE